MSSAVAERFDWLDKARGIGIILVVVGHALGGIIDSAMGTGQPGIRQAFFVIYTFHMPLFFMLSGAMVARRVTRSRTGFAQNLLIDLVWPYFLWSTIQLGVIYATGGLVNRPISDFWPLLLDLPFMPISQFWFLQSLFFLHLFAILALKALGRDGFLLACLALKPLGVLIALPLVALLAVNQAPWYGIGVFLAAAGLVDVVVSRSAIVRAAILPLAAVALIIVALAGAPGFHPAADLATAAAPALAGLAWNPTVFPAALVASFAVVGIAGFGLGPLGHMLAYLGQRSMPIFILHIMGIAGARIMLVKFLGITDLRIVLPFIVIVGIVAPLAAFALASRLGVTRALGLGRA